MLNLESKPDVQNQFGDNDATRRDNKTHQNPDATLFSSASGHILDEAGEPVSGLKIAITPVVDGKGTWFPIRERELALEDMPTRHVESDAEGRFTITDTISGPVMLSLFPFRGSVVRILRVQIGGLFFYPSGMMGAWNCICSTPG